METVPTPDPASAWSAAIFDVDGVLLASPHEQAWREALDGITDPARFTNALYQAEVAGRPRAAGALASLRALGIPNAERLAPAHQASSRDCISCHMQREPARDGGHTAFTDHRIPRVPPANKASNGSGLKLVPWKPLPPAIAEYLKTADEELAELEDESNAMTAAWQACKQRAETTMRPGVFGFKAFSHERAIYRQEGR